MYSEPSKSPFVVIQSACSCNLICSSCWWFLRTIKHGWTCGSWRQSWASVTSPTRATTAAGRPSPRSTRCLTPPTLCLLPRRRPLMTREGRMQMSSASRRESASSDQRWAGLVQRRGDKAGHAWDWGTDRKWSQMKLMEIMWLSICVTKSKCICCRFSTALATNQK